MTAKDKTLKNLQEIPGVGKSIANDLFLLGYRSVSDLKNENPESIYDHLCEKTNSKQDKCLLYVFRCAVYYASNSKHEPEKLKWWYWKDK